MGRFSKIRDQYLNHPAVEGLERWSIWNASDGEIQNICALWDRLTAQGASPENINAIFSAGMDVGYNNATHVDMG